MTSLFEQRATVPEVAQESIERMKAKPGRVIVTHEEAVLQFRDQQWVMTGPSGRHVLQDHATDRERLNAHWQTFASHPSNQEEPT